MTNYFDIPNPLIRDGVSQGQRQVIALSPDSVKIDERDLADFLVFAYRLSQQIIYYKANGQLDDNQPEGDWQEFFKNSTPVQIALISKTRPQIVRESYNENLRRFLEDQTQTNLANVISTFQNIFEQVQQWYQGLESDTPLKDIIKGLVKTNFQQALIQMQLLDFQGSFNISDFDSAFEIKLNLDSSPISSILPRVLQIDQSRLDTIFQSLFQNYRQIIQLASEYLLPSLAAKEDHQPHLALYLGFCEILKPAQDDFNRMTQRHLDFFYRKVLRLPEKQATPDLAHLIFELAKFQQEYKLDSSTTFKAGKDAKGMELFYTLNQEILVHQAQIISLKGLFLVSLTDINTDLKKLEEERLGLHVSSVVNSANGEGKEFPKEQIVKAWQPFGNADRPYADIGLAIASDTFYLQEGDRIVTLTLTFDRSPARIESSDLAEIFIVDFSGEKEWIVGDILSSNSAQSSLTNSVIKLVVNIPPDRKSIEAYSPELPGANLTTDKPVARIRIKSPSTYSYFRDLKITGLTILIAVSKVQDLILQTDQSVIDPTKPFQPFGSSPKVGMSFYIGSEEVFRKRLINLQFHVRLEKQISKDEDWEIYYEAYVDKSEFKPPGQILIKALRDREWQPINSSNSDEITRSLFELDESPFTVAELNRLKLNKLDNFSNTEALETWNYQTTNGFVQLQLTGQDFLHSQYPSVLARQVLATATSQLIKVSGITEKQRQAVIGAYYRIGSDIKKADKNYIDPNAEPILPNEPFTPVIQSLYLSYMAEANISDCQLFHLHPFDGFVELSDKSEFFVPQFINEGELILGLDNLKPPIALPLLFQVAEETANTELSREDLEIKWYYLANNTWQDFTDQVISDGTNRLITSGIVNLAIPAGISQGNTLLDPGLHWLKVAVANRSSAICNIVSVHTQAAQVTFSDRGNDAAHLTAPLAAGTITKLVDPQPEISRVEQPYDSFRGQPQENPSNYYTRISEQLRHKGRAVTIFDYERLVLEQFPTIYKVRCINHSHINEKDKLQELVPGSVTLAVIPDLSNRSTTNDLEPKVNVNLLEEITNYLRKLSSPWVDIRVVNPRYDLIDVKFKVQLKSPYQANFDYYQRELQRGIIGFLSPWTVKGGAEIHFGGKVYSSSILNFVEEQTYVDYVVNFEMNQGDQLNLREVVASSAHSIFSSVPFGDKNSTGHKHRIFDLGEDYQSSKQRQLE